MYNIYALFYEDLNRIYVGMTENLQRRINDHKRGKTRSTKNRGKFSVMIIEECQTREDARKREKYWKSGCGKEILKKYRGVEQFGSSSGS
ncbi:MAG: GIY-YIG nuclease family protein [Candidatus Moranbacteria bacterium]|nr:GIY-YIG nuclease family protein [Candidatus Moranbacteria bacterium]